MLSNDRGIGISEALHGSAQDPILVFFTLLTQLGDVWYLFLLAGVHYVSGDKFPKWGIDRRRGLFVLGLLLTYVALVGVLKQSFMLPRPPGAGIPPDIQWIPSALQGVFASISTGTGYGFPSGHALGSTLVWGGFALVVGKGKRSLCVARARERRNRHCLAFESRLGGSLCHRRRSRNRHRDRRSGRTLQDH